MSSLPWKKDFLLCRSEVLMLFFLATFVKSPRTYRSPCGPDRLLPYPAQSWGAPFQLQCLLVFSFITAMGPLVLNSDPCFDSLPWLWPCVITMNLPGDLDFCLKLVAPWPALLPSWGSGTRPGWRRPLLWALWSPHHSQPQWSLTCCMPAQGLLQVKQPERLKLWNMQFTSYHFLPYYQALMLVRKQPSSICGIMLWCSAFPH